MLLALGKNSTPCAFIMPERIAQTDPFKQIPEYIGSGPMKFAKSEWVPGAKAVFEKFTDYTPRQEKTSWLAGGKQMLVDRIEWVVIPDPATAAAALQNGEVDWWESPITDLVPSLKKNRNIEVDIADHVIEKAHCDARHIGSLDSSTPERATSSVTPRVREQVFARDEHCCRVPGCRSRRNLEVHHIHEQARGGTHELSNITLLCSGHHTALHLGLLQISGEAPHQIRVRWLTFEPVGKSVLVEPTGDRPPTSHAGRDESHPYAGTLKSFRWHFGRRRGESS
jgi:hypothetical protein